MKTMKKMNFSAKSQQKIEKCEEKVQKTEENLNFSPEVQKLMFLDSIPRVAYAYSLYCDHLAFMYLHSNVIIEEKNNVKGKKEIGK
jgi:hypothetical protein